MKTTIASLFFVCTAMLSDTPDTAVIVSTETVTKTLTREPRLVVLMFNDNGEVVADVNYETVTRFGTNVVLKVPFKSVSLTWHEITNSVPSLANSLEEFKAASKVSMTNTP